MFENVKRFFRSGAWQTVQNVLAIFGALVVVYVVYNGIARGAEPISCPAQSVSLERFKASVAKHVANTEYHEVTGRQADKLLAYHNAFPPPTSITAERVMYIIDLDRDRARILLFRKKCIFASSPISGGGLRTLIGHGV